MILIKIANKIQIFTDNTNLLELIIKENTFKNPKYISAIKNGYYAYGIPEFIELSTITNDGWCIIPRGYLYQLFINIQKYNETITELTDYRTKKHLTDLNFKANLFNYQQKGLVDLIKYDNGVLKAPAGSGKTIIGLSLIKSTMQKCLWLTHTTALANQATERMSSFLELNTSDIGRIGGGKWTIGNKVTIGLIQTLVRKSKELTDISNEFGLVILDEAHHAPSTTFIKVISKLNPYYLYGLTATDVRADGMQNILYRIIGPVTSKISREVVKNTGKLITPTIICKYTPFSSKSNQFTIILKELVENKERNKMIAHDVLEQLHNKDGKLNSCIIVTDRVAHAEILFRLIKKKWDKVGIAVGKYNKKFIAKQIEAISSGKITVIITTAALVGEGFDCPSLNRLFIGLPFRNIAKCEQLVGRIQRITENKTDALVFDYIDNHGLLLNQFKNTNNKGCRLDVYNKLGCNILTKEL